MRIRAWLIVGIAAVIATSIFIFSSGSESAAIRNIAVAEEVKSGIPVRLKIPKINVDAAVTSVGLTPRGEVGVPEGPAEAAWWSLGPRPGEAGSAVIDGHYGWKDGVPAVFDNLSELRAGDNVYVEDGTGATSTFVVRELRAYREHEDALNVFNPSDTGAHLNLITCGGVWNKAEKSYSERLVVFADKVSEL